VARALVTLAIALIALLAGPRARADEASELEKVRAAYQAANFGEAEAKLRTLLDPEKGMLRDPALVKRARMYWGAVFVARKQLGEASAMFEKVLLDDPEYEPDPLSFPSEVLDAFIDTKAKNRDRLNAAAAEAAKQTAAKKAREEEERRRQTELFEKLKADAAAERVVDLHSRCIALLPFGVGQFQNGQRALGWIFLGTEVALAGATAVLVPIFRDERASGYDEANQGRIYQANQYFARSNAVQTADWIVAGTFAATALLGVLHAQLTYVPNIQVARPAASARLSPFGVSGSF
jgi:hypothetical protein